MSCLNNREWSIQFPEIEGTNGPVEYLPHTFTFKEERGKLDYFRGKFSAEVGEQLKPYTQDPEHELGSRTSVNLNLDDKTVKTLMFNPNSVEYGDRYTHVTLYDLQRLLNNGTVDKKWRKATLREAYQFAFDRREDDGVFNELRFADLNGLEDVTFFVSDFAPDVKRVADDTERIVDGEYVIDFDSITPLAAIWQLNNKYRLQSWVDTDRNLWVGLPESSSNRHIVAPDDERVWRYSRVNIRHPDEPIKRIFVRGAWADQPGYNAENELREWFNPFGGNESSNLFGSGDVRPTGIASRTDIETGISLEVEVNAKKNTVEDIAKQVFMEKVYEHNSGTVVIDPVKSGDFTPIGELSLGDFLHVVPNDDAFSHRPAITAETGQIGDDPEDRPTEWCGQNVQNEVYTVKSIQHQLSGSGNWTMTVGVGLYPYDLNDVVGTTFRYYHPEKDDYFTESEVTQHGIESI